MKTWYVRHARSLEELATMLNAIEQESGVVWTVLTEGLAEDFSFTIIAYKQRS